MENVPELTGCAWIVLVKRSSLASGVDVLGIVGPVEALLSERVAICWTGVAEFDVRELDGCASIAL